MFLAYIRLFFRGSFVEITTAILLVYKILKNAVRCTWLLISVTVILLSL
jgi:hypothetical protein